jgi:hypothetical protein
LGNLCGESKPLRDHILLHTPVVTVMDRIIKHPAISRTLVKTICWLSHNLARFKELSAEHMAVCFNVAKQGMFVTNEDVVSDCLWTLCYFSDTDDDAQLGSIAQPDVLHVFCQSLENEKLGIYLPALKSIGSILSSNDQMVIDRCLWAGCLDQIATFIDHSLVQGSHHNFYLREACWALSNLTASNEGCVEKFVISRCYSQLLGVILDKNQRSDSRKEALWVICNAITNSS